MTTLIAVYSSDDCEGRCDAKCYEATTPDCDCVCGGRNHGKGRDQAVANTRQMTERMIAEYAARRGLAKYTGQVNDGVLQLPLF